MPEILDFIVTLAARNVAEDAMKKIVVEFPEVTKEIGFYKRCRSGGIYLHRRYPRFP